MSWLTYGCICVGIALIILIVCMTVAMRRDLREMREEEERELRCGEGDE